MQSASMEMLPREKLVEIRRAMTKLLETHTGTSDEEVSARDAAREVLFSTYTQEEQQRVVDAGNKILSEPPFSTYMSDKPPFTTMREAVKGLGTILIQRTLGVDT